MLSSNTIGRLRTSDTGIVAFAPVQARQQRCWCARIPLEWIHARPSGRTSIPFLPPWRADMDTCAPVRAHNIKLGWRSCFHTNALNRYLRCRCARTGANALISDGLDSPIASLARVDRRQLQEYRIALARKPLLFHHLLCYTIPYHTIPYHTIQYYSICAIPILYPQHCHYEYS